MNNTVPGPEPTDAPATEPTTGAAPAPATESPPEPALEPAPATEFPPEPEPAERPTYYYVLSDSNGFVGAFYTADDANAVVQQYSPIPFIIRRFEVSPGPVSMIWVVLFRDIDAVAFVSNCRAEAERMQNIYIRVGLSYSDSIDYWEHPANKIPKAVFERLEALKGAHEMFNDPDTLERLRAREEEDYERVERLTKVRADGPIAKLLRENEMITIFDCVQPIATGGEHVYADILSAEETAIATRAEEVAAAAEEVAAAAEEVAAATEEVAAAEEAAAAAEEAAAAAEEVAAAAEEVAAAAEEGAATEGN